MTDLNYRMDGVTRFEVIDGRDGAGRVLTAYDVEVRLSFQDDGRTLKMFLANREPGK